MYIWLETAEDCLTIASFSIDAHEYRRANRERPHSAKARLERKDKRIAMQEKKERKKGRQKDCNAKKDALELDKKLLK